MSDTLYCRPSDIVTASATLSWAVGTANAAYPVTNAQDGNPAKPAKANQTTATLRATFGSPLTLEMMSVPMHNLAGAASVVFSNNNGLSRAQTVPANRPDGLPVHFFDDFSAVSAATRSATQWDLVVTTALTNVAIGEWLLITTKRVMEIRFGAVEAEAHPSIVHTTDYRAKLKYSLGVSQRRLSGRVLDDTAAIRALFRSALGQYSGFLLVPDSTVNDALLVDLMIDERTIQNEGGALIEIDLDFLELQRGLAL